MSPPAPTSVPSTSIPTNRMPKLRNTQTVVNSKRGKYHFVMPPDALAIAIGESLGASLRPRPSSRVHGGSINECYRWEGDAGPLFVKLAPAAKAAMFEAEAAGLEELARANAVRVPRGLSTGSHAGTAWLALEWTQC